MDTLCLGFLYFGNSLRSITRGFGFFFKPNGSFKDGFGVRSIRVFSKFSLDPYIYIHIFHTCTVAVHVCYIAHVMYNYVHTYVYVFIHSDIDGQWISHVHRDQHMTLYNIM